MTHLARTVCGISLFVAALGATAFAVENASLIRARQLYAEQKYTDAKAELDKVVQSDLTDVERGEFDKLMIALPKAIEGASRSVQDKAAADRAYDGSNWPEAKRLYQAVIDNGYSHKADVDAARIRLAAIATVERGGAAPVAAQPAPAGAPTMPAPEPVIIMADGSPVEEPAGPLTPMERSQLRDSLLWQRAVAKMNEFAAAANQALAEKNYKLARESATEAVNVIEANRQYAQPPEKYTSAREQAEALRRQIHDEIDRLTALDADAQRSEIAAQVEKRRALLEQQRLEKIDQLFNTARELQKEQRFSEAAEAMRQVLLLDQANAMAMNNLEIYEDAASLRRQLDIRRESTRQFQDLLLETEEAIIPWHNDVLYPKNWLEISARRDIKDVGITTDEDGELNSKLDVLLDDVDFNDVALDQAFDRLKDESQVSNLVIDWDDLAGAGIQRDKAVSLSARNVPMRSVLEQMLSQVGGTVKLGYVAQGGLVRVATREKLDRNKHIVVYDIRDLLVDIPKFADAPKLDGVIDSGAAWRSYSHLFEGPALGIDGKSLDASNPESAAAEGGRSHTRDASRGLAKQIMDIMRDTVAPDSWRETGSGDGAMRELNGQLIVYNTSDAHRQVRDLLSQLRDTRALMIGVEARFLIVSSNFLEEIGVDLDFVFNNGNASYDRVFDGNGVPITDPFTGAPVLSPRPYSRAGTFPAVPGVGNPFTQGGNPLQPYGQAAFVPSQGGAIPSFRDTTPITAQQSSINIVDPTSVSTGLPGSFGGGNLIQPAFNLAGSFLDNLQIDFLIRATQANRRSSIVQAPRLMMFNGQRAWVAVVRDRSYVSSVNPQVAEGAVGVAPVIDNIQSGTSLDVEGTISADRKYVTITVRTGLSDEPTFTRFETQRASGNSPGIFILLPDQARRGIRTTVSVPDGGTVLLGGLKQVGEVEIEAGVPVLSKIPVLKRAFTNTTTVKDTQTLLILLKAKILIQKEAEDEAFPTFTSNR